MLGQIGIHGISIKYYLETTLFNTNVRRLFKISELPLYIRLDMQHLTIKQKTRQEKKKKKMAALVEIARLNDKDRQLKFEVEKRNLESRSADTSSEQPLRKKKRLNAIDSSPQQCEYPTSDEHSKCGEDIPCLEQEYNTLKLEYKIRKQKSKSYPRLRLKPAGEKASLTVPHDERVPLLMTDLQQLVLFSIMGRHSYLPSRWCQLEKYSDISHTVVLAVEGISIYHFSAYESLMKGITTLIDNKIEIITPENNRSLIEGLASLPHICSQKETLINEFGSLEAALQSVMNNLSMIRAVFPIRISVTKTDTLPETDKFSRKLLVMSIWQMVEEGYPLPLRGELCKKYRDFLLTKKSYAEINSSSPMFGLDCEMCRTKGGASELTRITIVNESHEIIYDKLVKPYNVITDYLTKYSGITEDMLKDVTTRLEDVQQDLRRILPDDAILIGHSLNFDLKALKMMHPYCIDTSVIFNITGDRMRKSKLQTMAMKYLGELIQMDPNGHDSAEDSLASLKLTQLKLKRTLDFGDSVLTGLRKSEENFSRNMANYDGNIDDSLKPAVVIGCEDIVQDYSQYFDNVNNHNISYETSTNKKDAITRLCNISPLHKFSLAHICVPSEDVEYATVENTLNELDQWIMDLWSHMAQNGLCVIIFSGQARAGSACFLGIKK